MSLQKYLGIPFLFLSIVSSVVDIVSGLEYSKNNTQEILNWKAPSVLRKMYPYFVSGFGREGEPVTVMEYGRWDIRATMEKEGDEIIDQFKDYTLQFWVRLAESPAIYKTGAEDYIFVADLDGYGPRQFGHAPSVGKALDMAREFVAVNRENQQRIKKIFLVNANYLFTTLYKSVQVILGSLANYVEVIGTNQDKWKPTLYLYIEKNQLPPFLGGSTNHKPVKVYG